MIKAKLTLGEFRKKVRGLPADTVIEVQSWADDPEDFDGACDGVEVYNRPPGKVIMLQCNSEEA